MREECGGKWEEGGGMREEEKKDRRREEPPSFPSSLPPSSSLGTLVKSREFLMHLGFLLLFSGKGEKIRGK